MFRSFAARLLLLLLVACSTGGGAGRLATVIEILQLA
jgi:hypothetical protein